MLRSWNSRDPMSGQFVLVTDVGRTILTGHGILSLRQPDRITRSTGSTATLVFKIAQQVRMPIPNQICQEQHYATSVAEFA